MPSDITFNVNYRLDQKASLIISLRTAADRQSDWKAHQDKNIVIVEDNEALTFEFSSENNLFGETEHNSSRMPFALKILVRGVNAITGIKEEGEARLDLTNTDSATGTVQNYLVPPLQQGLDWYKDINKIERPFIAINDEKMSTNSIQFIAMPMTQSQIDALKNEEKEIYAEDEQLEEGAPEDSKVDDSEWATYDVVKPRIGKFNVLEDSLGTDNRPKVIVSQWPVESFDKEKAHYFELEILNKMALEQSVLPPEPPINPAISRVNVPKSAFHGVIGKAGFYNKISKTTNDSNAKNNDKIEPKKKWFNCC